jgi:asparagine synthase (glutamine-hydrolysing)
VTDIALNLKHELYYADKHNKVALRQHFGHLLPDDISFRNKTSFDVGSGIRELVVNFLKEHNDCEKMILKHIWQQKTQYVPDNQYFHSYPVFDNAISKRGSKHR